VRSAVGDVKSFARGLVASAVLSIVLLAVTGEEALPHPAVLTAGAAGAAALGWLLGRRLAWSHPSTRTGGPFPALLVFVAVWFYGGSVVWDSLGPLPLPFRAADLLLLAGGVVATTAASRGSITSGPRR